MPEIQKETLYSMLDKVPESERGDFINHLKSRGYSIGGTANTNTAGQTIYPQQHEITKPEAAFEATKQALKTPIPGLNQAGKFLAETAPGFIAEKTGASSSPLVRGAGIAAGTALGTAGEMIPRTMGDVTLQAAAGPALRGLGMAAKATAPFRKLAGEMGTSLLARDIGVAEPFIENVKANPKVLRDLSNDMNVVMDHAKSLGDVMKRGVDRLGSHINAIEDHFVETQIKDPNSMKKVPMDDIIQKIKNIKFRSGVAEDGSAVHVLSEYGKPVQSNTTTLSKIDAIKGTDAEKINTYANEVSKIKDGANAIDLLRLKRQLGEEIAWDKGDETAKKIGSQANGILKGLYKDLQSKIDTVSPELRQANAEYSKARKQYDLLQRKIFGGSPEEAYNRVKLRIQRGIAPQSLIERSAQINSQSEKAMRSLIDKISAQQFSPYIRKGIAGGFMGVGAGAAMAGAMGGHGLVPLVADLAAAAASSPRMAALGIRGEAAAAEAISKLASQTAGIGQSNPLLLRALGQGLAGQNTNQ